MSENFYLPVNIWTRQAVTKYVFETDQARQGYDGQRKSILPDQSTAQHSYVPQTNRDSSNVIGRAILLPRYLPQTLKNKLLVIGQFLKMADSGPQELDERFYFLDTSSNIEK